MPSDREQEAARVLTELLALPVMRAILERLDGELPPELRYHGAQHTHDVLREVVLFALLGGVPPRDIELLAIAAAYHDSGYLYRAEHNEAIGARIAREEMLRAGYAEAEILLVETMILDTRVIETARGPRQIPTVPLSRYLLDADLSNFGRTDFFEKGELQRTERGEERGRFLRNTFMLISNHCWHTEAAAALRQEQKQRNVDELRRMLRDAGAAAAGGAVPEVDLDRLRFLAQLPLLINSSLDRRQVIEAALGEVTRILECEAATVFLASPGGEELTFWAAIGGQPSLEGRRMAAHRGIVGWVIDNQEPVIVPDVQHDPRFFGEFDREGGFVTRSLVCVPLTVRDGVRLGALQVLNRTTAKSFTVPDLFFAEQFAQQLALALDNAQLYRELAERNHQLEVLDRRKNEIITVIAHEFRTPLNVVLNAAEVLASGMIEDRAASSRLSGMLQEGVDRISKLLGEINNISLLSADVLPLVRSRVDVAALLERAVRLFAEPARGRKLTLRLEPVDLALAVEADAGLLLIALKSLLSNALRFTPDGGKITVMASANGGLAQISVADTGIGIDRAHLPLIFEKFYEVKDAMQHHSGEFEFRSGGLGLGLATARAILRAHESEIEVVSEPGRGSTFSFRLPISPPLTF